jgi:hypothetical protein
MGRRPPRGRDNAGPALNRISHDSRQIAEKRRCLDAILKPRRSFKRADRIRHGQRILMRRTWQSRPFGNSSRHCPLNKLFNVDRFFHCYFPIFDIDDGCDASVTYEF